MNKLLILPLCLLMAVCVSAQDVSEIISKVKAKQATLINVELRYESCVKSFSSEDTSYYLFSGYVLDRKGNAFNGKFINSVVFQKEGKTMHDTFMELVQGVDIITCKKNNRQYYSKYRTDEVLDPVFYRGLNTQSIEKFKLKEEDSLTYTLIKKGKGRDNLGNEFQVLERLLVRKMDYMVVQFESILFMFGGEDYSKETLVEIKPIEEVQKKQLLKDLKSEFKLLQKSGPSFEEFEKKRRKDAEKGVSLRVGDIFPDFIGQLPGRNDSLRLSELKDSVIILDYFFTSCGPCVSAIPHLKSLSEKYKSRSVRLLGIDPLPQDTSKLKLYVSKYRIPYTVLRTSKEIPEKCNLHFYPTLFILDINRKIVAVYEGYDDYTHQEIEAEILKLLKR